MPAVQSGRLSFKAVFVYSSRIPILEGSFMLKKILIGVLALIVLLVATVVILAFAVKTDLKVEREVTINRPKAEVFDYVKKLKNQNSWGPWHKKDPAMKQE